MFKTILQFSKCRVYLTVLCILAYSSMVERPAVNRMVAGSSPAMPVLENEKENEL